MPRPELSTATKHRRYAICQPETEAARRAGVQKQEEAGDAAIRLTKRPYHPIRKRRTQAPPGAGEQEMERARAEEEAGAGNNNHT